MTEHKREWFCDYFKFNKPPKDPNNSIGKCRLTGDDVLSGCTVICSDFKWTKTMYETLEKLGKID